MNLEDMEAVAKALGDEVVKSFGLQVEWCATYATARAAGATPAEAATAAYAEWDL